MDFSSLSTDQSGGRLSLSICPSVNLQVYDLCTGLLVPRSENISNFKSDQSGYPTQLSNISSLPCSKSSVFHHHSKSLRVSNVFPPLHHVQQRLLVLQLAFLCAVLYAFVELFSLWGRGGEECLHHLFYFSLPNKIKKSSLLSRGQQAVYASWLTTGLNITFRCVISKYTCNSSTVWSRYRTSSNIFSQFYLY